MQIHRWQIFAFVPGHTFVYDWHHWVISTENHSLRLNIVVMLATSDVSWSSSLSSGFGPNASLSTRRPLLLPSWHGVRCVISLPSIRSQVLFSYLDDLNKYKTWIGTWFLIGIAVCLQRKEVHKPYQMTERKDTKILMRSSFAWRHLHAYFQNPEKCHGKRKPTICLGNWQRQITLVLYLVPGSAKFVARTSWLLVLF